MAIDISQITGAFITSQIIGAVIVVPSTLGVIYFTFVGIRQVLAMIRGDTATADVWGIQSFRNYDQRIQNHNTKLRYEKRYLREKRNSDYKKWKKFREH
jgi:hypothetical protein